MQQVHPLSPHSRALLLQLSLQCQFARHHLLSCRHASTSSTPPTAKPSQKSQAQRAAAPTPQKPSAPISPKSTIVPTPEPNPLLNPFAKEPSNDDHTVRPLSRPLGLPTPPLPGQNTGIDTRTWRQRRDDFVNYDKHLGKRKAFMKEVSTPYFREWTNLQYAKGKTFLAPSSLLRAQKALYFPNLHGQTLSSRSPLPTTPLLHGHISIVSLFSGTWAERQVATFLSPTANPELHTLLTALQTTTIPSRTTLSETGEHIHAEEQTEALVHHLSINIEENWLKAWLIRLFLPRLRRQKPPAEWTKYFLVTRGITPQMREALGVGNSKVGYVYLVDRQCRVRWAGSGRAEEGERKSLVRGVGRLVEEWRRERETGGGRQVRGKAVGEGMRAGEKGLVNGGREIIASGTTMAAAVR